jgi:hypothetical protein
VLKNETRARPKSATWRERQLIPQQQAVSKVWLMTGIGPDPEISAVLS